MNKKYLIHIGFVIVFFFSRNAMSDSFVNALKMKFVYINAGSFWMGSPESELGHQPDELLHQVTITHGFYISTTEVTQKQWIRLMGFNPSTFTKCGNKCPVENVSWHECIEFIAKLNKLEKTNSYRLPTEAEWEYAARADTRTAIANGEISYQFCEIDPLLNKIAWYCGNSGEQEPTGNLLSHPVAQKIPNAWGIYDMHGNVHEWCQDSCDWKHVWSRETGPVTMTYQQNIVDPLETKGSRRIFRGGSWNQSARYSRSASRSYFHPNTRRNNIGFRIVKTKN
ncbi:MAG: formylglycine-generating enzyme family protein [Desulfobacterales bacterium]|nr:formylglycine-generating enzyme family protein [Desulfobacterales bacterium]